MQPAFNIIWIFLIGVIVAAAIRAIFGRNRLSTEAGAVLDEMVQDRGSEQKRTSEAGRLMGPKACIDPRGVFFSEYSGLFAVYELMPLPADGLSRQEAQRHADRLERQLMKLPPAFTLNWWKTKEIIASAESLVELPEFVTNPHSLSDQKAREEAIRARPLLEALYESRREVLAGSREFVNRIFVAVEYHGNFAFGGTDIGFFDALGAGWRALWTRDPQKRHEEILQFKSIWPGSDTAITNLLYSRAMDDVDLLLREGRRFFEVLSSEIKPDLVSQASTDQAGGLGYRLLGPEEGARALKGLADKHPRRLAKFAFPKELWGRLGSVLADETVDFGALYGRRNEHGGVSYPGQFAFGGMPRKIYSIRQLPGGEDKIHPGLFDFLDSIPYLVTYRLRWHALPPEEGRGEMKTIKKRIADTQMRLPNQAESKDDVRVNREMDQMEEATVDRQYGHLTILIDVAGWPGKDHRGRDISPVEDLEAACDLLETKFRALDIMWAEEVDRQDVAFLGLFPGKVSFERLERLKTHSDVFAALAPLHDPYQPERKVTEMDPKAPFLMTRNRSGRHELRTPVSGKVLFALVLGESGGGKSFLLQSNAVGYKLADPRSQVDCIEAGASMEVSALANGGSAIYVGDPERPAKVNPFDIPGLGPDGYDMQSRNDLHLMIEAMIAWPSYSDQDQATLSEALVMLGTMPVLDGTGVRSVNTLALHLHGLGETGRRMADALRDFRSDDPKRPGRYSWIFPAVPNEAAAGFVDYIFPVLPKDPRAEALHLLAILQQFRRRADGLHPHLFLLDEAHRFLNVTVGDESLRATALALSKILNDILTQGRKLNLGLIICTQFASHLDLWDRSLRENLRNSLGVWFILPMKDEAVKDLKVLVAKEAGDNEPDDAKAHRLAEAERQIRPIVEAAMRISKADYEFVMVKGGMPQILRLDEGWTGKAIFETGGAAMAVKRQIQDHYLGTQLGKVKAFERALREVRAGRLEWTDVTKALKEGTWHAA